LQRQDTGAQFVRYRDLNATNRETGSRHPTSDQPPGAESAAACWCFAVRKLSRCQQSCTMYGSPSIR